MTSQSVVFGSNGTAIPLSNSRFFSHPSSEFYKLQNVDILPGLKSLCELTSTDFTKVSCALDQLTNQIKLDKTLSGLTNGTPLPFVVAPSPYTDIGTILEKSILPLVQKQFVNKFPSSYFKAISQDKSSLETNLFCRDSTNYHHFLDSLSHPLIGFYFPTAFNQFSLSSQIDLLHNIQSQLNYCLSGPLEVGMVLSAYPELLISSEFYSPVLLAGGVSHTNKNLVPCFKSYGPHLEFWLLSNLLTRDIEQISEQWSGGLTIYSTLL